MMLDTINPGTIGSTKLYTPKSYVMPVNSFDSLKCTNNTQMILVVAPPMKLANACRPFVRPLAKPITSGSIAAPMIPNYSAVARAIIAI